MKRVQLFVVGIILMSLCGQVFSNVLEDLYELAVVLDTQKSFSELVKTDGFVSALKNIEETQGAAEILNELVTELKIDNTVFSTHRISFLYDDLYALFSDNSEVFSIDDFPWTAMFREHYREIRDVYLAYEERLVYIPKFIEIFYGNDVVLPNKTQIDERLENPWKVLYLRYANIDTDNAERFPITMCLVNKTPCCEAMFSVLTPYARLKKHIDPYKGIIRYHLALEVPQDSQNCFLVINDKKLHWAEGQDLMFDERCFHWAENNTDERRVVLFLSIKRAFTNSIVEWINNTILDLLNIEIGAGIKCINDSALRTI